MYFHKITQIVVSISLPQVSAAQELLNVEVAQRTRDTPPAMQYENVAPLEYFARLVANF